MTLVRMACGPFSTAFVPTMMMHLFSTPQEMINKRCVQRFIAIGRQRRDLGVRGFSSLSRRTGERSTKAASIVPYIEIQDVSSDGWKLSPAIEILKQAPKVSSFSLLFSGHLVDLDNENFRAGSESFQRIPAICSLHRSIREQVLRGNPLTSSYFNLIR
jgi:hypothetical protein